MKKIKDATFTFRLSIEDKEKLEEYAELNDMSAARAVRMILEEFFSKKEEK